MGLQTLFFSVRVACNALTTPVEAAAALNNLICAGRIDAESVVEDSGNFSDEAVAKAEAALDLDVHRPVLVQADPETERLAERLLDSEEHAGECAIPDVAEDAAKAIRKQNEALRAAQQSLADSVAQANKLRSALLDVEAILGSHPEVDTGNSKVHFAYHKAKAALR